MRNRSFYRTYLMNWLPLLVAICLVLAISFVQKKWRAAEGDPVTLSRKELSNLLHNSRVDLLTNMVKRKTITEEELGETLRDEEEISEEQLQRYLEEVRR